MTKEIDALNYSKNDIIASDSVDIVTDSFYNDQGKAIWFIKNDKSVLRVINNSFIVWLGKENDLFGEWIGINDIYNKIVILNMIIGIFNE